MKVIRKNIREEKYLVAVMAFLMIVILVAMCAGLTVMMLWLAEMFCSEKI